MSGKHKRQQKFKPDWRLSAEDSLATHIKVALYKRNVKISENIWFDYQWTEMCAEIINGLKNDPFSPYDVVPIHKEPRRKQ